MNLSRVASGFFQYSRKNTGSSFRCTAISPSSPGGSSLPWSSITATRCPGYGRPIEPGCTAQAAWLRGAGGGGDWDGEMTSSAPGNGHAPGPRPVGRRPEQIPGLREEVVRMHEPRDIADDQAMRLQRALRRAGGAAGVDDDRRIIGARIDRLEIATGPLQQRLPGMHAGFPLAAARLRDVVARRHAPAEVAVELGVAVDHGLIQFT